MKIFNKIMILFICCFLTPFLIYKNWELKHYLNRYQIVSHELVVVSDEQQEIIARLLKFIDSMRTIEVKATGYTPSKNECDETPHVT